MKKIDQLVCKYISIKSILIRGIDVEKIENSDVVFEILRKSIDSVYIKKYIKANHLEIDRIKIHELGPIIQYLGYRDAQFFWSGLFRKDLKKYVPVFFNTTRGLSATDIRNLLLHFPEIFEMGTIKDFELILKKVKAKELIATFYDSHLEQNRSRWMREGVKKQPSKINVELANHLEQLVFMDTISGKTTRSRFLENNLKYMKENIV